MGRINRLARGRKRRGDRRCIDQIRGDVYLDLLTGRNQTHSIKDPEQTTPGRKAVVDIRADLSTLLGHDDDPGEIPGWGPVIADITRRLVDDQRDAEWRVGITEADRLIDLITTRRRPTAAQQRLVETLDPECVFPTCRIGSTDCDLDHEIPWAQSHRTTVRKLEPACRHHHGHKHGKWTLEQIRPGVYKWTSPLGHTYLVGPDPP